MAETATKKPAAKKAEPKKDDNGDKDYTSYDVEIHGRPYRAVDGRIAEWRDDLKEAGKAGEVIFKEAFWESEGVLVCQVRCYCPLNGYGEASAGAYGKSAIDRSNPYENAETSAWGRLLGFWGYGLLGGGIASAEEVTDAKKRQGTTETNTDDELEEVRLRTGIRDMLLELADGDLEKFSDLLEQATSFIGRDGETVPGKRDLKHLSSKALYPTYGRVKEMHGGGVVRDPSTDLDPESEQFLKDNPGWPYE